MLGPLLVWIPVIIFFLPAYIIFLIICGSWRLSVNFIVWKWKPSILAHFTSRDLAFTCDDFQGRVRKSMINVTEVKGHLDLASLREVMRTRVVENPYCFKFQCRPVLYLGYWFWQKVDFELNSHILEHDREETDDTLKVFLPKWGAQKFGDGAPLWAVLLVRMNNGRTAIISKYHHMLGDGVSFMRMLEYFCDGGWVHLQAPPPRSMTWTHWIYAWYTFPWNVVTSYRLARIRKGFRPTIYCGEGITSWTEIPLEKIRVIRRSTKCLFLTVMGGIMSNAFHRLLENNGKEVPKKIRMVVPIPYPRRTDKTIVNHCAWLHSEMPLGGGEEALLQFDKSMKRSYMLGMHGVMWEFFKSMYLMPQLMLKRWTTWGELNIPPVLLSSVPGALGQVNVLGHEVLRSFPVLNLGCSMGVNATVTTYKDFATFGIRVSKEVIGTQELLDQMVKKYLHEEVDILYHQALASQLLDGTDPNCNNPHVQIKVQHEKA